jgi:hypothetical protein
MGFRIVSQIKHFFAKLYCQCEFLLADKTLKKLLRRAMRRERPGVSGAFSISSTNYSLHPVHSPDGFLFRNKHVIIHHRLSSLRGFCFSTRHVDPPAALKPRAASCQTVCEPMHPSSALFSSLCMRGLFMLGDFRSLPRPLTTVGETFYFPANDFNHLIDLWNN